jgi:hypothetical protein
MLPSILLSSIYTLSNRVLMPAMRTYWSAVPYYPPAGPDSWKVDPSYLTVEQAMADYTVSRWLLSNLCTRSQLLRWIGLHALRCMIALLLL